MFARNECAVARGLILAALGLAAIFSSSLQAETPPASEAISSQAEALTSETSLLTPETLKKHQEEIRQKLAALESAGLEEEDRKKSAEFYQKALNALASLEEYRTQLAFHVQEIDEYENDLKDFQEKFARISEAASAPASPVNSDTTDQEVTQQEQTVQQAQADLDKSEKQLKNRQTRLAEIPQQTVEVQQELEKISAQYAQAASEDASNVLASAERDYLWCRIEALKMSLAEMEKQRHYFSMSPDLAQIRRDYRAKYLAQEEKKLAALREIVDQRRLAEAEEQATAAARMAAVERPAAIAELASRNKLLADQQTLIAAKNAELTGDLATVTEQHETLRKKFERSKAQVSTAGSTEVGRDLRRQQEQLPDYRAIGRRIALRNQEKEEIWHKHSDLMDRRAEIVDAGADERLNQILKEISPDQRAGAEQVVRQLLEDESQILNSAIKTYDAHLRQLTELSAAEDKLRTEAQSYADFIAERVLWIRSTGWPNLADLEAAGGAVAWTIDPANWRTAFEALRKKARQTPLAVLLFVTVMCFSTYMNRQLRIWLRTIGEQATKRTSTEFWPSLQALWITLLLSLPWPMLLGFVGWWMDSPLNESEFVRALSVSLQFTALCLLLLELVRHLCRNVGLADAHFNWPQSCLLQVRRHVRWLIWVGLPLVLWLTGLEVQNVEKLWSSSIGRACFVAVMLSLSFASYKIVLSGCSPFRQLFMNNAESAVLRLFHVWSPLITALPLLLAFVALIGYHFTAQQLALRLLQTASLLLALSIVGGLAKRWILVNRRRLAREQARQKRAQAATIAAPSTVSDETAPVTPAELIEDSVDLVALGEQTSKLLFTILIGVGLASAWFVWRDMLPALAHFGQQPFLPLQGDEKLEDVLKWGQLLRFLVILVVTFVAVRNLPAVVEFAILQRLPLDSGSRYAITSISRYVLVGMGLVMSYNALGFDPTSIQWLVAAMGVGLGFGLQEIFANFVSGIILLFERPIRVGDIVTLGDKTGTVSRIRMRATTILDPDRKEYIVPNKDLVTERLLNWTLTDPTNRIVIKVGVAYGSDTELACRLLREAAYEHPLVLKEPEPVASLDAFGPSTLDFALRCFLPSMEKRLQTTHDLNSSINRKFAEAGLEMAYPQTDVYVKSWPEKWPQPGVRAVGNEKEYPTARAGRQSA